LLASATLVLGAFARVDDVVTAEPAQDRASASPAPVSGTLAPYPMRLWTLQFVDDQHGFVSASLGSDWSLLRTQDGGVTWTKNALPASVAELQFVSPLAGWLLTSGCTATNGKLSTSCRAALLHTADGGQTWTQLVERSGPGLGSGPWSSPRFIDERTGWVLEEANSCKPVACRNVLRTSDGGHSWDAMTSAPLALAGLVPVDATHVWAFGSGGLLFTGDGGSTWVRQLDLSGVPPQSIRGIDFVDARHGWALAFDGAMCTASSCAGYALYATDDGGATWQVRATDSSFSGCGGQLTTPRFVDRMVGWIGVNHGAGGVRSRWGVLVTTDGGEKWSCRSSADAFDVIEPLDQRGAWAIADRGGVSLLLRTSSGGSTWTEAIAQASTPPVPPIPVSRSVVVAGSLAPKAASTTATTTALWTVSALAVDTRGDIFIAELSGCAKVQYCGSRVRRVDARTGSIEIVAGTGAPGYEYENKRCCRGSGSGSDATTTYLGLVNALAVDRLGRLYVGASDPLRYGAVWRVDPDSKRIELIAGGLDGPGASQPQRDADGDPAVGALLFSVWSLAVDDEGNVYIGDGGGYRIRELSSDGTIRTVMGTGSLAGYAEPGHRGTETPMYGAAGLALDRDGSLYFAETTANRVRRLDTLGIVRAVAGTGDIGATGDGLPATLARIKRPNALAIDSRDRSYIADGGAIRRVDRDGTIRTMLQLENMLTPASLTSVSALAIGTDDALYVAGGTVPLVRKVVFEE
jgi:photosystem II stability/assembly factor-like uncharacterized protein/sugar lactone lactonase YvrE